MADDRGSRDWLPPLLETDEFEPEELEDSEMVELPKRALPVKPGIQHMRSLKHSGSSDLTEEICNMLKIQHAEVMQRFDQLGLVLKEVSENVQGKSLPVNRMPSVKAKAQKQVRLNLPQGATEIKRKPTFTPKLFSSLTQADMLLKQGAADVDADQAKAKKESLASQTMSVANGSCLHAFVLSNHFDVFFAVAILTNMVFIGFEVQYNLENPGPESVMIQVVRNVYTGLFSMELLLRICASGCRSFLCGRDMKWNLLDLFIVLSSWWEAFVEIAYAFHVDGLESVVGLAGLRTLRIVRITRLVKIARITRLLRFVMALRTLTQSILYTLKSLIWALVLLTLIVYVFGILFAQAVNDHITDPALPPLSDQALAMSEIYFGNLWLAMLSLFMSIAGGVSWEQVLVPLQAISWIWVMVFLFYISFTYFAVLNVVTGVFCQSAIDSAQSDHDAVLQSILANKQAHIEKIRYLFNEIDAEDTGVITYQMFQNKVGTKEVQTYFESIDLDIWDAWSFFKLLDLDNGGAIEVEEFLMGCLRLRGSARAMDMAKLCHDQAWLIKNTARFWTFVEEELHRTKKRLDMLTGPSRE